VNDTPSHPRSSAGRRRVPRPRSASGSDPGADETQRFRRRADRPLRVADDAAEEAREEATAPGWLAVARGVALFLGAFTLLNLIGEVRGASHDAHLGWIDLRPLTVEAARGFLGLTGGLLLLFAVHPGQPRFFRGLTILGVLTLFGASLWNAYQYYEQIRDAEIHARIPISFSLHVAACLAVVFAGLVARGGRSARPGRDLFVVLLTIAVCAAGFPLAQFYCQGKTDYRHAADAAVIFACDAPPGDDPSKSLEARVRTASRLYQDQLVRKLILTGGPGKGGMHEAEVMRRLAIEFGVPAADLISDTSGTATEAGVKGTLELFEQHGVHDVLVVSDFYLLPRIKLCYRRFGNEVDTVPAEEVAGVGNLRELQHELVREATALWVFYLQPLVL